MTHETLLEQIEANERAGLLEPEDVRRDLDEADASNAALTAQLAAATRRAEEAERDRDDALVKGRDAIVLAAQQWEQERTRLAARVGELETSLEATLRRLSDLMAHANGMATDLLRADLATPSAAPATPPPLGVVPVGDGLPSVGGEHTEATWAEHDRRCRMLLAEEQEKPSPNNALIAVLCDSVRLVREAVAFARAPIAAPASLSAPAMCGTCGGLGRIPDVPESSCPDCGKPDGPDCAEPEARLCESVEVVRSFDDERSSPLWYADVKMPDEPRNTGGELWCVEEERARIIAARLSQPLTRSEREQLRAAKPGTEG